MYDFAIRAGSNNTRSISFMNRSYQEKMPVYRSVSKFFTSHFKSADACVLSSHLVKPDIKQMIDELKKRFFNVCGVFFQNSIENDSQDNADIALLDWDEKFLVENPRVTNTTWTNAIHKAAVELTYHIITKA